MMVSLYYVIQEMHSFSMRPAKYFYDKPLTIYLDSKTVLIYRPHHVYEEAISHIWLCNCSTLNFLIYEENLFFFFISVVVPTNFFRDAGLRLEVTDRLRQGPRGLQGLLLPDRNRFGDRRVWLFQPFTIYFFFREKIFFKCIAIYQATFEIDEV